MTINERLFATLKEKNKLKAHLCAELGVGTAQASAWERNGTDPPAKYLVQIANFLGVSLEYLLTGEDTSARLTPLEAEVMSLFRQLPIEQQYEFKGELKGYAIAAGLLQEGDSEAVS